MELIKGALVLAILSLDRAQSRATDFYVHRSSFADRRVNLSSVWLLPEEGYPVFYRYFRDRITWYEADAVCQFHHGQLITVDTSSEFDAARAYLKELDVANFVWTGLKRLSSKQNFLWPDSKPMENAEGHWAVEIPKMDEPLCAAIDPSSDYRWQPLPCSGPTVAAFICQMQVPPWAQTEDGCMLTSLPSLTVTFLPEQGAVELISDCGLEGTRRIACKGQAKREDMMRQLSCETSTEATSSSDTWDDQPTRHRRESEVTQDMSSHPNTTQDMGTTDEESTTTEQTVTTETSSTAEETSVEDPAKNMTVATTTVHSPTQGHVELSLPLHDQPAAAPQTGSPSSSAPQTKKPYSSKPIPPSLKGNSPFVETPVPLVTPTRMNVSDETEGPPDSHETLGREGEPSRTPASLATHPSLEQYKKNVHDSGEDHTEETGGTTGNNNITRGSPATGGGASSTTVPSTPDMLADEPDLPERPNRGRLLVHPQHHSFYAYFLNRVLG